MKTLFSVEDRETPLATLWYLKELYDANELTSSARLLLEQPNFTDIYQDNDLKNRLYPKLSLTRIDRTIISIAISSGRGDLYYAAGREGSNELSKLKDEFPVSFMNGLSSQMDFSQEIIFHIISNLSTIEPLISLRQSNFRNREFIDDPLSLNM